MTAGALGLGGYARWIEPHWLEIVRRPLDIRHLPHALVGAMLVQISDVHVGRQVNPEFLVGSFERISRLEPDIVVLTGDYVTSHEQAFGALERTLEHLPHGRRGTLAVLGNHDHGLRWSQSAHANRITDMLRAAGVTVLRNQRHDIDGLQIVGLDDLWAGCFRPTDVLPSLDRSAATLVLSHNPDSVDEPGWGDYDGWILSGHTHGGQCKPPFLPPPILPVRNKRYTAGAFALDGERKLYISRGLGHLHQVRFNVRPEITVFELTRA
ncbi:MAG: metallophosphoesterase [Phycisphaeraceae bacterium]|nr:metallophosphoesterase [Phycisphaeraceae bacterium]